MPEKIILKKDTAFQEKAGKKSKIKIVGVGGAGGSAIKRMLKEKISEVEYIAINTDLQVLKTLGKNVKKIQIGKLLTRGQGTGSDPDLGQAAVEENISEIKKALKGAEIVFLTAGFGGGTGTGAGLAVADILEQMKILTISVVTKPFTFEGPHKKNIADQGIKKLINRVDSLIVISNDRLLQAIDRSTPILEAFNIADEVLKQGVKGIIDILNVPGLINIDFANVKPILQQAGKTFLGMGSAQGENRALEAAKSALKNPLINLSVKGANGVVFVITGSPDLKMMEVNEIAEMVSQQADLRAKIVFGAVIDEKLKDEIKITLIATGFEENNYHNFSSQIFESDEEKQDSENGEKLSQEKDSENDEKKVYVYHEKKQGLDENEKRREITMEDELEIPAFLRKKLKKK